ncbi:MAG TPA: NAD-dependent epimerase/dehydratase family protein [Vicinamibacterales bacterium]|nr:NAD-dependent epimerase/dehydratase family protein [Vicinamibacterales bacterium]
MRVLLIGGSGFIGPHVVSALQRAGHETIVFHRGTARSSFAGPPPQEIIGDRRHLADRRDQLRGLHADVVIDLVLSSGRQARELMEVFRGATARVVALSSCDVYRACGVLHGSEPGPLEPVPLSEDSPLRTVLRTYPPEQIQMLQKVFGWLDDEYDKIPVEREILGDAELPATVLRLPMVYGPGDPLHRLQPIVKRIDDGRRVILFEDRLARWRAPRGYVGNVAAAIALAATHARSAGRVYNAGEPQCLSEFEWATRVVAIAGWSGQLVTLPAERVPPHLLMPGNADQQWTTDTTRIREELGYREPIAQDEAIRRTIEWERANPTTSRPHAFDYAAEDAAAKEFIGS